MGAFVLAKTADITPEQKSVITLHFDVTDHSIPLSQFISSAQSLQAIVDDFNDEFFDGELKYNFHILPPQKGGLLEQLWLILNSGVLPVGVMWAFIVSEPGKAYIKELTGKTPSEFAAELGKKHRNLFSKNNDDEDKNDNIKNKLIAALVAYILAGMVMGFVENKPEKLEEFGLSKKKHRIAYDARNSIIKACINNNYVNGLGFDESHSFSIKKDEFNRHLVEMPPEEDVDDDVKWIADSVYIKVYSPNWKREGKRQWQGDTEKFSEVTFSIEDEAFWLRVKQENIQPTTHDTIKAQWVHPDARNKKPVKIQVLKVLQYNGRDISAPLSDDEIEEIIGNFSRKPSDNQIAMFDN